VLMVPNIDPERCSARFLTRSVLTSHSRSTTHDKIVHQELRLPDCSTPPF
jgi:hypothetical protein